MILWKTLIFCSICSIALGGVIHDAEPLEAETDHHLKIDHEHAQSHQSFKIHHYHAVPVYVKHEDQHLLKNPVEVGGVKHKLKIVHPQTEHNHGHGLTLENHTEEKDFRLHGYEHYGESNHNYRTVDGHGNDAGNVAVEPQDDLSHHQFQDINVHHGHGE